MILITGATGFLGRNVCEYLAAQGYPLRALVRPTSHTAFLKSLNVELAIGDVLDFDSVQSAMQGCEYVIHTAAYFRLWGPPEPFELTNVGGTHNVLAAALAQQVKRFIHISTIIVVGPQASGVVITEETSCNPYPSDNYAKTKWKGECLVQSYIEQGLPAIILRLGALYGPYGHYAFNRLFFEEYLRNWRIEVNRGRHIIFPCFVGDAANAIEASLHNGNIGNIYNISNESISHHQANKTISHLTGRSNWRINFPRWLIIQFVKLLEVIAIFTNREPFYPKNLEPYVFCDWVVNCDKAKRELNFKPSTFTEGAKRTLEWYRSIGFRA